MKPKVVLYSRISNDLIRQLEKHCNLYQIKKEDSGFIPHLSKAEGIIGSGLKIDEDFLSIAPNIRIVTNISAGYDNLDIEALTKLNILATNTPDVLTETTADAIFGLLLSTARRIPELDSYVKLGEWTSKLSEEKFGIDVHHKKLGIIGMGRIGRAVAKRANFGFNMDILYYNRSRDWEAENELNASYASMSDLLRESDFVCLSAPLSSETRNLIGYKELSMMKKEGIFINGSRGELVVEEELTEVLKNKKIRAAGLDVYREEPIDSSNPLLELENVVTLPHIGSATKETRYKMEKLAVENLLQGIKGHKPPCLINKEVINEF